MPGEGDLPASLEWLAGWTRDTYEVVLRGSADREADPDKEGVRMLLVESVRELISQAAKHAHVNRVTVDLALAPGDIIRITVADDRPGFDPAILLETASGQPAPGLVAIRERVARAGGRFGADSAPGAGGRSALDAPRHGRETGSPETAGSATPPRPPLRILLVDDHARVREGLRELLADHVELTVVGEAADGIGAVDLANELNPDVVVMDVSMPRLDGIEATRRICAELPHVTVFGLSTHEQGDRPHAIEVAGASGYFEKGAPLIRLINRLLAEHAKR